jgi:hypothetical protein
MCDFLKRKFKEPDDHDGEFIRMDGLSMRAPKGDFNDQLNRLHGNLERRLGIPISRSAAVRHAVALADEQTSNEIGVGGY